jgi:hypothetical protein
MHSDECAHKPRAPGDPAGERSAGGPALRFSDLAPGTELGPLHLTVSEAANRRYLDAAGVQHPVFDGGVLYPPIAANLTILAFLERCADPVIQTRQVLHCSGLLRAGVPLVVTGGVTAAYDKRGRRYVDVCARVAPAATPDATVWESEVNFTPAGGAGP